MDIVDIKENLHDARVLAILSHSLYMPTKEKLHRIANDCEADPDVLAYVGNFCAYGVLIPLRHAMKRDEPRRREVRSFCMGVS